MVSLELLLQSTDPAEANQRILLVEKSKAPGLQLHMAANTGRP